MKFRALMIENAAMREFLNVALSLSRFSKTCVLRLTKSKIYFIVSEDDTGPRRPLVWCELPVSFYFKEYNIVGVNEVQNEIYLELSTILLARCCAVLKHDVKHFKIKLTSKETPCLTLDMELVSLMMGRLPSPQGKQYRIVQCNKMSGELLSRQCVHDIPVDVISRKHWGDYAEPSFNEFHASIQMPNLKSIKSIVEKMKNMSHCLVVRANKSGELTLEIKTSIIKLSAHFSHLNVHSFAGGQLASEAVEDGEAVSSTIDIKKFLTFLSGMQLNNCQAICNIVQGKMVKLSMEQPGVLVLQIFLTELSI